MSTSAPNNMQKLITDFGTSKNNFKLAIFCCNKLIDSFKEYEKVTNDPDTFVKNYFNDIRNQINEDRNAKLQAVNKVYEDFLDDLKNLENECANSIPDDKNLDEESSRLKKKLNGWIGELTDNNLDEVRCEVIKLEAQKLEKELELKHAELKTSCLSRKSIEFHSKDISLDFKGGLVVKTSSKAFKLNFSI